ncbi:MAG: hypothetical protein K2J02_00265 [Malacoplasma sp.]|nr:hypothetical protein [Malacoplasma sp.]
MSKISKKNKKTKLLFASALLGIASIATVPILLTACGNNNSSSNQSSNNEENNNNNNDNQNDGEQPKTETANIIFDSWDIDGKTGSYFTVDENNTINFEVVTQKELTVDSIKQDIWKGEWIERTSETGKTTAWYVLNDYKNVEGFRTFLNYGLNQADGGKGIIDSGWSQLQENYIDFDAITSDLINGNATIIWTPSNNTLSVKVDFSLKDGIIWASKQNYNIQFTLRILQNTKNN